ncbi:MAG TPA: hypothetical protein VES66_08580 [Terriglobales bacterium]|nr:hypothetical protein [Terriglobales bacterium]
MPDEILIERDVDPATGAVTRTITEHLDSNGDVVFTTTDYDKSGGIVRKVIERHLRPKSGDVSERWNLVERITLDYSDDGRTVWRETVETFGNGVNETPQTKSETDWVVDKTVPGGRWRRFVRFYHWEEKPAGHWVQDTTYEFNQDGTIKAVTHP